MSLNRAEQLLFDYVQRHPEEGQYWREKVLVMSARHAADKHAAATALESELWRYFEERSRVVAPFREQVGAEGLRRISLRNLAELWLRLWVAPRPRPPALEAQPGGT